MKLPGSPLKWGPRCDRPKPTFTNLRLTVKNQQTYLGMMSFKPGVSPDPSKGVAALDGQWVKQRHLSDMGAYAKQLDLMNVTGIKKIAAVQLFQGLHIRSDQEGMHAPCHDIFCHFSKVSHLEKMLCTAGFKTFNKTFKDCFGMGSLLRGTLQWSYQCFGGLAGMSVSIVAPRLPFGVTERFSLKEETAMKRRDGYSGKQTGRLRPVPGGIQIETLWDPPHSGKAYSF
jgi:hypothetical protein